MNFENEKAHKDQYYSVGYCPKLDKYVLSVVVPWAVFYNQYYEITKKEYDSFGSESLDALVMELRRTMTSSERFLFSDLMIDNSPAQLALKKQLEG